MTVQPESFVELVALMRAAQTRYFRDRTQHALAESKRLEQEVDQWIEVHHGYQLQLPA